MPLVRGNFLQSLLCPNGFYLICSIIHQDLYLLVFIASIVYNLLDCRWFFMQACK